MTYADRTSKRDRRYKAVLNAPLGRKAYWEYKTRHSGAIPSLHQLKTMRRALVQKERDRMARKATSLGTVYAAAKADLQASMGLHDIPAHKLVVIDSVSETWRLMQDVWADSVRKSTDKLMEPDRRYVANPITGRMSSTEPNIRTPRCKVPPLGWRCTREAGHDGPCATVRAWPENLTSSTPTGKEAFDKMTGGLKNYSWNYWPQLKAYEKFVVLADTSEVERKLYQRLVEGTSAQEEQMIMNPSAYNQATRETGSAPATFYPTVYDNRKQGTLRAFRDIPNGAFVEETRYGNVGIKASNGIAWLNYKSTDGGYTTPSQIPPHTEYRQLTNVTVTIG